jgi:hypothetical protein
VNSWLDQIIDSTQELESPARYYYWAGLACIAATIKKNIYLDRFRYKLYPNIYVMLVSEKSGLRKGAPISLANSLLKIVNNTRVVGGRNSIQAVMRDFGLQTTLEGGQVLSEAQGILLSDEFASFLVNDPSALTILTGLFNTHEHQNGWKNSLKGSAVEVLKNPCINLLGASNETLFNEVICDKDIEGGFLARTFVVYEADMRTVNPLMEKPKHLLPDEDLAQHLICLKNLKGEFKLDNQAKELYVDWYHALHKSDMKKDDRSGTIERLGDQVLKAAMLISLASTLELIITRDVLSEAISKSQGCYLGMSRISRGQGKSEFAHPTRIILKELISIDTREISREMILRRHWSNLDGPVLDRVIETLMQSKAIVAFRRKGDIWYKITDEAFEQYMGFEGRNNGNNRNHGL